MTAPHNLNVHAPWTHVLDVLGIHPKSQVLPAVVHCPLCKHDRLLIFEDRLRSGQWFYCQDCKKAGDIIQLAAKAWGLTVAAAIGKLAQGGLDIPTDEGEVRSYILASVEQRRSAAAFWKESRHRSLHTSTTVPKLLQELNFECEVSPERRKWGPARMFGWAAVKRIVKLYHPKARLEKTGEDRAGPCRMFQGERWDDVVVIPFRDLPMRFCGFLCIGRNGDPEKDYVYHRFPLQGGRLGNMFEAGLAMHPGALAEAKQWDGQLLAIDDPILATQIQCRHFERSTHPLPIVAYYRQLPLRRKAGVETRCAWHWLYDKRLVFWMPKLDRDVVAQAVRTGGKISTIGPKNEEWQTYLDRLSPRDLVQKVFDAAKPWPQALGRMLLDADDEEVEDLFRRLAMGGEDLDLLLQQCTPKLRQRVRAVMADDDQTASISVDGVDVSERNGGWYMVGGKYKKPERICDAILRITEVVNHAQAHKVYYKGYVRYQGTKVPFCESRDLVEKDTFGWMAQLLIDAEAGLMRFNRSRSKQAVMIATEFHQPKFVKGIDIVGWEAKESRFLLPRYAVHSGGDVIAHNMQTFSHNAPARALLEPTVLSAFEMDMLTPDEHATGLLWASITAVLGNILAPAFNEETTGIGLYGPGAEAVGEAVADAAGCLIMELSKKEHLYALLEAESRHHWPVVVAPGATVRKNLMQQWVESDRRSNHNCVMPVDWWHYVSKSLAGGWSMVVGDRGFQITKDMTAALRVFFPAYLKDLCDRRLQIGHWDKSEPWLTYVLRDIRNFVAELTQHADWIDAAADCLVPDSEKGNADAFADIISELLVRNKLHVVRAGFEVEDQAAIIQSDDGIFVGRTVLAEQLGKLHLSLADHLRVTSVLAHGGVLRQEREDGWVIDAEWWLDHHRKRTSTASGLLKVHR